MAVVLADTGGVWNDIFDDMGKKYDELRDKFKAPGDFAMAYVVAHEVGHHIQIQLGVSDKLNKLRQELSEKEFNKYSVKFELQADYLDGWDTFNSND
jgi:predicted metalloprotease